MFLDSQESRNWPIKNFLTRDDVKLSPGAKFISPGAIFGHHFHLPPKKVAGFWWRPAFSLSRNILYNVPGKVYLVHFSISSKKCTWSQIRSQIWKVRFLRDFGIFNFRSNFQNDFRTSNHFWKFEKIRLIAFYHSAFSIIQKTDFSFFKNDQTCRKSDTNFHY